ncbi:MAG: DsbA family protein [Kiloniellales bacterium]
MTTRPIGMTLCLRHLAAGLLLALSLALSAPAAAQDQSTPAAGAAQSLPGSFSPEQVEGIERLIQQYLMNNPQVLVESLNRFQQRQRVADQQRKQQAVRVHRKALYEDPDTPVFGNLEGDVAIVEFFDYRCPYCRKVAPTIKKVMEEDGKIRLVMKEFPILGPKSVQAARAALAAAKQGKYEEFHWALMMKPGDMSAPHIRQTARDVGLDVKRLEDDMKSPDIERMIQINRQLATALSIQGTPAFVIGNALVPGAIDLPTLKRLVAEARANAS